jgi:hypothetical protein
MFPGESAGERRNVKCGHGCCGRRVVVRQLRLASASFFDRQDRGEGTCNFTGPSVRFSHSGSY